MKNHWIPEKTSTYWKWRGEELVKVLGLSGYYVTRFNQIVSFRSPGGTLVSTHMNKSGKYTLPCVQLFDDDGKRHLYSLRRVLVRTLGKDEYERREKLRANMDEILTAEETEAMAKRQERKAKGWQLFEMQCDLGGYL